MTLEAFANREKIKYTPQALVPYARWITPQVETKRFDTWFFIAKMPKYQTSSHDDVELVDSIWLTPMEALKKSDEKKILLMPPTLKTITELAAFTSIERLFKNTKDKVILPILPQVISSGTSRGVILPHDPEYTLPEFKQAARPGDPSRIVLEDGKWTVGFA